MRNNSNSIPDSTSQTAQGREYHVSPQGNDGNDGAAHAPLKTISAAALLAQPGDVVTVHAGVYRERVDPPRGGQSEDRRIVYQAAPGELVEIKGSEVIKGWTQVGLEGAHADAWSVRVPNSIFGDFNPFADVIKGDWFSALGRVHHTGAVYVDGRALAEGESPAEVLNPALEKPCWCANVSTDYTTHSKFWDTAATTIWARFPGVDPNEATVEINVRQCVFYPRSPGINYLTVRGFTMRHAATPWAPPTAEQIGLIGTHWSKGWIIERNVISDSRCVGLTLGKYGDEWDNKAASPEGYVGTIKRALANGWAKGSVGHHSVRHNTISHCGQAGMVGSLGAVFSEVCGNAIHDIFCGETFHGAEQAGIKLHGAIDVVLRNNHIFRSGLFGIHLDWMAQGVRVSANLCHDNADYDIYMETNHGPHVVDNNLFLSRGSLFYSSEGGAFVHNLMSGFLYFLPDAEGCGRQTPYLLPHSTEIAGSGDVPGGDDHFWNNLIQDVGRLQHYAEKSPLPVTCGGNAALPSSPRLVEEDGCWRLHLSPPSPGQPCQAITATLLGEAGKMRLPHENPDGSPVTFNTDYFGNPRNPTAPCAGPFENAVPAELTFTVWPQNSNTDESNQQSKDEGNE